MTCLCIYQNIPVPQRLIRKWISRLQFAEVCIPSVLGFISSSLPDLKFCFLRQKIAKTLLHFLTEGVELKIVVTVTQASKPWRKFFLFQSVAKKNGKVHLLHVRGIADDEKLPTCQLKVPPFSLPFTLNGPYKVIFDF